MVKKRINKKRVIIFIVLTFIILGIGFKELFGLHIPYVNTIVMGINSLFISPLGYTNKTFDNNPMISMNETNGISCRTFIKDKPNYEYVNINIDPDKTAIVLLDLWEQKGLDEFIEHKIIPLLELARKKKIAIIHAPSQRHENINHLIDIHPDDIVIKNYENADKELSSRGIDTLLYVGRDTLFCVLDKPLGIFHTNLRNEEFKTILIRDGVISKTYETNQLATNIIETNFGCSITIEDLYDYFMEEVPENIFYNITFLENSSFDLDKDEILFEPEQSAIVIVNYFDDIINKRVEKNIKEKINPLIEYTRFNDITTIYVSSSKDSSEGYEFYSNEYLISSEEQFMNILEKKKIKKLFYVGHFLNSDIMFGPAGISRLYIQKRYYYHKNLPDYYIVSDASLAFEISETLSNQIFKKTLLKYYRDIQTIELGDLMRR